jgi:hypothetical protein
VEWFNGEPCQIGQNRVGVFIKGPYQAGHRVSVSGANWCESRGVARRTAHAIHEKRDKGCLGMYGVDPVRRCP